MTAPTITYNGRKLPAVMSTEQVANWLQCQPNTLRKMVAEGTAPLTPIRVGRCYRWSTTDVLRLVIGGDPEVTL